MRFKAALISICFLLTAVTANAATFNFAVTSAGDGYYHNESGRSYDYFDASSQNVSAHYQYWGYSEDLGTNTGYAQFNIAGAALLKEIVSVTLNLNITGSYLTSPTPDAGRILHVANSSAATGNASQRIGGGELVSTVSAGLSGWQSFDITEYILNDLNNGYSWAAFSFAPNTTGNYSDRYAGFSFSSAESGVPAFISITTAEVPAPASIFLLGFSLIGLSAIGRKI